MNKNLFVLLTLLALSLAALLLHVADTPISFKGPPIKIGVVVPLSGDLAVHGNMALQGAWMAVEEINNGGILGGRKIHLEVRDSESNPAAAEALCRSLITEKNITAILAVADNASRQRMAAVTKKETIPLLYATDYDGGECDRHVFYYSEIPELSTVPMVSYLLATHGPGIFMFGQDTSWSRKIAAIATKHIHAEGGHVAGVEFTPHGAPDYSQVLQRIRESRAKALLLMPSGKDGTRFIHQFNTSPLKGVVTIAAVSFDESHLTEFSPGDLEGIHTCLHFMASLDRPETRAFVTRHKKHFPDSPYPPTHITEGSSSLMKMFASALNRAGSLDLRKAIELMPGTRVQGGNGIVTLRDDHHVNMHMVIGRFEQGKLVPVKSLGRVTPEDQCPSDT
ncbi:ethanolamine utilization protein EutJ [Desulfoluna limicola]|uniref:Ethanolamine utilization protein EutJ n=1 Tax=Desulfoluna limicola TaxID=2810562 RepID=A0ABM7PE87_9BACT|nr:substrate-binding protein [Desulfoluna limicola]BCS95484.1 ethanolamine utilization protein EutJ [Desulfoluna limicola]